MKEKAESEKNKSWKWKRKPWMWKKKFQVKKNGTVKMQRNKKLAEIEKMFMQSKLNTFKVFLVSNVSGLKYYVYFDQFHAIGLFLYPVKQSENFNFKKQSF